MNICDYSMNNVREIILKQAKYQKVMLVFGDYVSNLEINEVYNSIKDICVFNKIHFSKDLSVLIDGYKLAIFMLSETEFLQTKFVRSEQINLFLPTTNNFFAFYFDNSSFSLCDDYLMLKPQNIDANLNFSLIFNDFLNYFKSLYYAEDYNSILPTKFEITKQANLHNIKNIFNKQEFLDFAILKHAKLDYSLLQTLDYVLINSFYCFFNAISNNSLSIIDVYKVANENNELIDKFYRLMQDDNLLTIIKLNLNLLMPKLNFAKKEIESNLTTHLNKKQIEEIVCAIKEFAKQENSILSYLYFYDVFSI